MTKNMEVKIIFDENVNEEFAENILETIFEKIALKGIIDFVYINDKLYYESK